VELLLPFMAIIDVTLKMSFSSKSLATIWVRTFVVFGMISLMVFQLVWLIEDLIATRLITCMYAILG
jgi:hypothetical protein